MKTIMVFALLLCVSRAADTVQLIAVDPAMFPPESRRLIEACNGDLAAVAAGRSPANAKFVSMATDGGTREFIGEGYRITVYRQWCEVGGIPSAMIGPRVEFVPPLADADLHLGVSFVRLIPRAELRRDPPNQPAPAQRP